MFSGGSKRDQWHEMGEWRIPNWMEYQPRLNQKHMPALNCISSFASVLL